MLEIRDITLVRGGMPILSGVSANFTPGEFVAIVGPNGAGKSSLVRILTGEWKPDRGQADLDGRNLASFARRQVARRMAVVPQASAIGFDFLVEEIVALGRLPHATGAAFDKAAVAEALSMLALGSFAARQYLTLSGGERQRVQLARALVQIWPGPEVAAPPILVLDEPTSALDLAQQHVALETAASRARGGALVIAVLHDLNLAAEYADRLLVLKAGRLVADGVPAEIMSDRSVSDWFGCPVDIWQEDGRPPQVRARRSNSDFHTPGKQEHGAPK
jgi:iron complex transport system ATP-binding protein